MDISFRAIASDELNELYEIASKIWHDHYTEIIGKEQVDFMLETIYDKKSLKESIDKGQAFYFILKNDQKLGFFSITNENELWLNKLYVNTNLQGQGIGKIVLDFINNSMQPDIIKLTVNRQNFKSINFYFKNGFKIEKVEDFDIGNGYWMNDFIMVKKNN
jgi:ribosomal protein S18 acetylase RimI-like enzyme